MKKIVFLLLMSYSLFSKSITFSIGIENSGDLEKADYTTNSNPRVDAEYMHYFDKIGLGAVAGLNFLNVENEKFLTITNVGVASSLKLVEKDNYYVYTQINIGYPYNFVTTYHMDEVLQSIKATLYHELKIGCTYNDFNINLGFSTLYLKVSENNNSFNDSLKRLSVNLGYLAF